MVLNRSLLRAITSFRIIFCVSFAYSCEPVDSETQKTQTSFKSILLCKIISAVPSLGFTELVISTIVEFDPCQWYSSLLLHLCSYILR